LVFLPRFFWGEGAGGGLSVEAGWHCDVNVVAAFFFLGGGGGVHWG